MNVPKPLFTGASLCFAVLFALVALPVGGAASPLLGPPLVGDLNQPDVKVSERKNGPYKGEDKYRGKQRLTLEISKRPVTSFVTVENDATANVPGTLYRLRASKGSRLVSSKYFNENGRNISAALFRGRYTVNLPAATESVIKQKISLSKKSKGKRLKKSFPVKARNTTNAALKDAAEVQVRKLKK